jgi:hypothetical protein
VTDAPISVIDVKVDTQDCALGENVADLRFELGVKSSAEQSSHALIEP